MNGLDLFSGIGGISEALSPWVRTVAYCERDAYAQGVLLSRMLSGDLERAPIWDDVSSLRGAMLPSIDIIFGGFPCQDISVAGRGTGLEGERSGLFFEIVRLIRECKPTFIFLENVPAIRTRGLHTVVKELSDLGYDSRWTCVSAQEVGANHKRNRWFLLASNSDSISIRNRKQRLPWRRSEGVRDEGSLESSFDGTEESLANSNRKGELQFTENWNEARLRTRISGSHVADSKSIRRCEGRTESTRFKRRSQPSGSGDSLANADGIRLEESELGCKPLETRWTDSTSVAGWWTIEPNVGRVANGVPSRVDRIRCLGNAVVPVQAQAAFKELAGIE